MSIREWVQVAGIFLIASGLMCFPFLSASPKSWTSIFITFAELGAFSKIGLGLFIAGLIVLLISMLIPKTK